MSVLRLYWQPGWPDASTMLPWAWLDHRGQCVEQGEGGPAAWPRADRLELVLPAGMTLFASVRLPGGRELRQTALGYALEAQLGNDPAANVYVCGETLADGQRSVAACEAAPLRRCLAMLRQLGRLADRIVPEETLLPVPAPGEWVLAVLPHGCLVRSGRDSACLLPAATLDWGLARLALSVPPQSIQVLGSLPAGLSLPAPWQQVAAHWQWQHGRPQGVDFAHGELAAARHWRQLAPLLRQSGRWLGLTLLLQTVLLYGQWGWYAWQKHGLQQTIRQQVQPWAPQALPGSSSLPMLRAVDRVRLARGLPARDDLTEAMAQLAAVNRGQLQLQSLRYEAGRLAFTAPALDERQAGHWREQLAARQWQLNSSRNAQGQREWILIREPA